MVYYEKVDNFVIKLTLTGFWIKENEDGTTSKGYYTSSGKRTGTWKTYDKGGVLISETEYASFSKQTYVLRDVELKDGQAIVISEKTWFAKFYLRNVLLLMIILLGAFFIRLPINNLILKRKYGAIPERGIPFSSAFYKRAPYMLTSLLTFWWTNLETKNKTLGRLSNVFSCIALGGFLVVIVGLAISGEL